MDSSQLVEYYKDNSKALHAWDLSQYDRTICFIINNRVEKAISIDNPVYKRMSDLLNEAVLSIKEMQYDIDRMFKKNHGNLIIEDGILVKHVLPLLLENTLSNSEECLAYLDDVGTIAYSVLNSNPDLDDKSILMFKVVIQLCTIAMNKFNQVLEKPIIVPGVSISFERRKEAGEYAARFY